MASYGYLGEDGKKLESAVKIMAIEALLLYRDSAMERREAILRSLRTCGKYGEALADFISGYDGKVEDLMS